MLARLIFSHHIAPLPRFTNPIFTRWYSVIEPPRSHLQHSELQKNELCDPINPQNETDTPSLDSLPNTKSTPDLHYPQIQADATRIIKQNYNEITGRIDWDAVTRELNLSEFECLELFSHEKTSIEQRKLPKSKWTKKDTDSMKQFIKRNYPDPATIPWDTVAKYTNVITADCITKFNSLKKHIWTDEEKLQVVNLHKRGLSWAAIKEKMNIPGGLYVYKWIYNDHMTKQRLANKIRTSFKTKERRRVRELFNATHTMDPNDPKLIEIVAKEFPHRPRKCVENVILLIYKKCAKDVLGFMRRREFIDLIEQHGKNWIKIGLLMNKHPIVLRNAWAKLKHRYPDVGWEKDKNIPEDEPKDKIDELKRKINEKI